MIRTRTSKTLLAVITGATAGLVLAACTGTSGSPSAPGTTAVSTVATPANTPVDVPTTSPADVPTSAAPTTPAAPAETAAQANARHKAADYLSFMAFSRDGLVDQLVKGDQFEQADAEYGVDAQNADWNAQAVAKAKDYLAMMAFSHAGLVDQLVQGDRFTPAQAEYGVKGAGL